MYAVVKTGGKQYKVDEGDLIRVERIDLPVGDLVELGEVTLVADAGAVTAGAVALASAKVVAQVAGHGLAKKIRVYKYKKRKGYERTQGHRQMYTELLIQKIQR